ncbi:MULTISPECIES: DNA polymerase III subunit gamma/tau [unclassified Roseitalea]|uniref:DNA polymerase III subunit gamma/tau n=1 Tax=unclassified Roseitalea TaxID=2639107 RepID=UPI00273E06A5|nr:MULTISPECIES: DNA polymerase III subunit gamma/tau [unclassified Roseitalea]
MSESAPAAHPYRVLARKYRPADFTALIGQAPMVRTLTNAFAADRIAQAWMLTGVRGVGKTTTARILARALNYRTDDVDRPSIDLAVPGIHCQAIMEGRHVDVVEMDAASHTGIDDVKQIIDSVRYAPVSARYKVYIIDEIHMLSEKAFNALLKTLEEPPPHAKFIFATTEIRKVPITVLSRCQRFDLRRIEIGELTGHLRWVAEREQVAVDDASLAMIARAAEGSVRDALSILDQAIAHGNGTVDTEAVRAMLGLADRSRIVDLFEHVMAGRVAEALDGYKALYDVGADPVVTLNDLAAFTHLVTRLRFIEGAADEDPSLSPDERERGRRFAASLSVTVLARAWQMLLKGIAECESAARPYAAGEMLLIRLAHAATLPTLDEALRKLDDAPSAPAPARQAPGASAPPPSEPVGSAPHAQAAPVSAVAMPQSPQGGAATAMRLVADGAPRPQSPASDPEPAPAPAPPAVRIESLQDLADLAERHRDPLMKVTIRKCVRLVSVEPGRLAVNVTEDAPPTLAGDLSRKLGDWTGTRWIVTISREPGGKTLEEDELDRRDALLADASRDPQVAAILKAFPGARVVDVRLNDAGAVDEALPTADMVRDEAVIDPDDSSETD